MLAEIGEHMARVPITVMGYRCDRCAHEWIPRPGAIEEPRVCPSCHSTLWNQPDKKPRLSYDDFKSRIRKVLSEASGPLTWTEVRTLAALPQAFPNNQWVRRMESDIALTRRRGSDGIIHWSLKETLFNGATSAETTDKVCASARRK